jgi:predicted nucleic acid-binding Zn ribbon protein
MGWEPLPTTERDPAALGGGLDAVVRRLGGGHAMTMIRVVEHWPSIIGEDLAAATTPVRIDQGCLTVSTVDAAFTTEIRFRQQQVCRRIAELCGDGGVERLRVTIGRAVPKAR